VVEGGYVCSFKSTVNKKSKELALYTTNLNTHITVLTRTYEGATLLDATTASSSSLTSSSASIFGGSSSSSIFSSASSMVSMSSSPPNSTAVSTPVQGVRKQASNSRNSGKDDAAAAVAATTGVNGVNGNHVPDESMLVSTVTFGAPCGHALGFKQGGLRKLMTKLEAECNKQHKNPESTLSFLHLRFQAKAREAVVLSQAIGAVVIASIDVLSRHVTSRNIHVLKQYQQIGLLIHSVLLLSTHGNEECMMDDFAGAYERLHVTLKLIGPASEKTVGFSLDHLSYGGGSDGDIGGGGGGGGGGGSGRESAFSDENSSRRGTNASGSYSAYSLGSSMGASRQSKLTKMHDKAEDKWKKMLGEENEKDNEDKIEHVFKVIKVLRNGKPPPEENTSDIQMNEDTFDSTAKSPMSSSSRTSAEDSSSHMTSSVFGDNMKNSSAGNVTVVLQVNSREHYDWLKSELGEEPQINLLPNLFNLGKAFFFFFSCPAIL
jgi:hypothetical protein